MSPLGSRLTSSQTSQRPRGGRAAKLALTRGTPVTSMVESAKLALKRRRVQWHFPRAPTPGTEQRAPTLEPSNKERAPTQEPALSKRNVFRPWCRGFRLGLAGCYGSFSGVLFSRARSCLFLFLLFLHRPRASRSSSWREGRRVKREGTDPRSGTGHRPEDRLFQVTLWTFDVLGLWFPASEATSRRDTWLCASLRVRWLAIAGPPGATILGARPSTSSANHRFQSRRQVPNTLWIVDGVRDGRFCAS